MKTLFLFLFSTFFLLSAQAQTDSIQNISKLEINKKKSKTFTSRDSALILNIDTLIMKDRSKMIFYGKKKVKVYVKHAIIGNDVFIYGTDGKNNGSDMDFSIGFDQLGSLTVSAAGLDAHNGTKTYPNGNGGKVNLNYLSSGVIPQQVNKKENAYLSIDIKAGGNSVNAQNDIRNILSRIGSGTRPLGQLPQGQVYSGSPGIDGKSEVKAIFEF